MEGKNNVFTETKQSELIEDFSNALLKARMNEASPVNNFVNLSSSELEDICNWRLYLKEKVPDVFDLLPLQIIRMLSSQAGLLALCEQHKELLVFEDYTFLITPALRAVEAICVIMHRRVISL